MLLSYAWEQKGINMDSTYHLKIIKIKNKTNPHQKNRRQPNKQNQQQQNTEFYFQMVHFLQIDLYILDTVGAKKSEWRKKHGY